MRVLTASLPSGCQRTAACQGDVLCSATSLRLQVKSLGHRQEKPFVATPEGKRRPLTQSELDDLRRQWPVPRRRVG